MDEPGSPVSQQSLVGVSEGTVEDESSAGGRSLPSDSSGAQRSQSPRVSGSQSTIYFGKIY